MAEEEIKEEKLNIVDEARKIHEELLKTKEELKEQNDRRERLQAEELLGGTSGGHVEAPTMTKEELTTKGAKEFFKGTALEDAISKANG